MKNIYQDELYGEVAYIETGYGAWEKTAPFMLPYNGGECPVTFCVEFVDQIYLEIKYGISNEFSLDELSEEEIDNAEKWEKEQRELYIKYLQKPNAMMKMVEDEIVEEYYSQRKNNYRDEAECVRFLGRDKAEKMMGADTREKILDLVKFKKMILADDGIVILGDCAWYDTDFGVKVTTEGFVYTGLEENVY